MYNLTAEKIQKEYDILGSAFELDKKYPFFRSYFDFYRLFIELNINVSTKKSANNKRILEKRKRTTFERLGVYHNMDKNSSSRKKWEKRLLEEEGITNVFQRESVKQRLTETIIRRYETELWKHALTVRGSGIISKINKIVFDILEEEGIDFKIEFKIKKDNGYYYSYDILIGNKIIEVNGDYWHCNPKVYKSTYILLRGTSGEKTAKEKWTVDKIKNDYAIRKGYKMLIIWEYNLKNDYENTRKEILKYARS